MRILFGLDHFNFCQYRQIIWRKKFAVVKSKCQINFFLSLESKLNFSIKDQWYVILYSCERALYFRCFSWASYCFNFHFYIKRVSYIFFAVVVIILFYFILFFRLCVQILLLACRMCVYYCLLRLNYCFQIRMFWTFSFCLPDLFFCGWFSL